MKADQSISRMHFNNLVILKLFIFLLFIPAAALSQVSSPKIPLGDVFQFIETETDYSVFYQNNQLDLSKAVEFNSESDEVDNILALAFKDLELKYEYVNMQIVITPQATVIETKQEQVIRGRVIDESGETLIGVSISLKGTTTGTITDFDGLYTIAVDDIK